MSAIKIFDKFPHVLIILLVCSRIIPHPPNFTPLIATAVICGVFYKNTFLTIFILIFSMFVSDIFLGFHSYMFFVYFSIILIYLILLSIKNFKSSYRNILFACFMSSILLYIITNVAVWINSGFYEKSFGHRCGWIYRIKSCREIINKKL